MLSLISSKLLLITLICALTSSANSETKSGQKNVYTNFREIYERFDNLSDKITELLTELVAHVSFVRNQVYYEVIETNATWDEADRKCHEKGMTLAMMKDQETSDFVLTKTRALFTVRNYFWLGLKFNEVTNQWQWVDGSRLGGFGRQQGHFETFTKGNCCLMYLYEWNVLCYPVHCASMNYSICEKRLSPAYVDPN